MTDPEVKRLGDQILNEARRAIAHAAGDNADRYFKLNRWVFSRLQLDERQVKERIKKQLWDSGMQACQGRCGERFESLTGVEIHRKDPALGYSIENCMLLCRKCHREVHGARRGP